MRLSISRRLRLVLVVAFALPICLEAADPVTLSTPIKLSVPVRVLGGIPAAEGSNMRMRREPTELTLTRGLLPQYQRVGAFRSNAAEPPDPKKTALRFLLALPEQLLLIEASVTINDQPFERIREQRIDRLIAELNKPVTATPAVEVATPVAEVATPVAEVRPPDEAASPGEPAVQPAVEAAQPDEGAVGPAKSADEPAADDSETKNADADADADADAVADADAESEGDAESEDKPAVELIPALSSALNARLRRYATVTGRPLSRNEVRWLLTKWVDGPTLLLLDENFQRFRSAQAPAFQILDRDMDGTISADELKAAPETMRSCDVNQNDVVEYTEIAEVAHDPRRKSNATPTHGLIPLLDAPSVATSFRRIAKRYASPESLRRFDANSDGALDEFEIAKLAEIEPDVTVTVAFDARDSAKSTITVTRISARLAVTDDQTRRLGSSITIPVGKTLLEFSAVQSSALSDSDQISVGVVDDGYPLLPAIDPNEDGRLTIRELRDVLAHLRSVDTDQDGGISPAELPSTIRMAFGLGPSVHRHLADIRTVHPPSLVAKVAVPKWFTTMDGNKDGDISPREFLLGDEHFKKLDADNDGLVSAEEGANAAKLGAEK